MWKKLLMAAAMLAVTGCSYVLVKAPPPEGERPADEPLECTSSWTVPVLDFVGAGLYAWQTVRVARSDDDLALEATVGSAVITGALARSGWGGQKKVSACRDAQLEQLREQLRESAAEVARKGPVPPLRTSEPE